MEKQFRYPGTRPFQENDRNLFFGRNKDIKNLSELIVLEKMVVLFSKSGYGKSSLLNAGVIPRLTEKEKFQVLNIRLNEQAKNPVDLVRHHLSKKAESNKFLSSKFNIPAELPNDPAAILWYYAKSIQLADKTTKALVLVFDQFEELSNFSNSEIADFASTLATLLNLNLPESVRMLLRKKLEAGKGYFTEEETDQLLEPLNLKVVFSLRNDRISLLNKLKGSLPAIFKKTYELQPLDEFQALEALLEPAEEPGDFASPEFTYSEDAIALILNSLKDQENQRIETFQLQLICQHAEELIIGKAGTQTKRLELSAEELGNPEDIFENHYNTIIASLPAACQHKARILIEDKLIIGGNRVPLPESVIIEEHQISADLLKTLVDKRLLRSEPNTVGGLSFELSHDTLVAPIQKTAKVRRLQEAYEKAEKDQLEKASIQRKLRRTRILLGTAGVALVIAVIALFFAFVQRNKARNQEATSKALILAYSVIDHLEFGLGFIALRTAEAAYQKALKADSLPNRVFLKAISNALYDPESLQISYFDGHQDAVNSVAISLDAKYFLTGSSDNTAILWDSKGNVIQRFKEHKGAIWSVAFSPDGNSILTGSEDGTAIIWDNKGNVIQKLEGHEGAVWSVTFSKDGKYLLTGSNDYTAILWDTQGNLIQKFDDHEDAVSSVAFAPDGKSILTGSFDKTAILWDILGNPIKKFEGHQESITSVSFSTDGKFLLSGSDDFTAILWNTDGTKIQKFIGHEANVTSVAFSPDGNYILTGGWDNKAILWDKKGNNIKEFEGYQIWISSIAFSPDGNSVITGGGDNTAILWDIQGKPTPIFEAHQGSTTSVAFSPNGNSILTGSGDKTAILWDFLGKPIQKFKGHKDSVSSVAFSPDGNFVLTGSADNTSILWNNKGTIIQKFEGHQDAVSSVAFSPKGKSILTGSEDFTAILWNADGTKIQEFIGHMANVTSVAFSPDGNSILTGSFDSSAILWDIEGKSIQKFEGHRGSVHSVAFSPDGKFVLTGSDDKTAILWDRKGKSINKLKAHWAAITSVAFSPDGNTIITGSEDYTSILWDRMGKPINIFRMYENEVTSVAFSPNGNSVITGSGNDAILLKTPQGIFNWLQSPDCPLRQLTEEEKAKYGIIESKD